MAERSFVEEVKKLRLSGGEVFSGEGTGVFVGSTTEISGVGEADGS